MNLKNIDIRKKITLIVLIIILLLMIIPSIAYVYDSHKKELDIKEKIKSVVLNPDNISNQQVMDEVLTQISDSKNNTLKENNNLSDSINIYQKIVEKVKEIKNNKKENEKDEKTNIDQREIDKLAEIAEEDISLSEEPIVITPRNTYNKKFKPKIAIIIDDVVTLAQKNKILNIGYPITMSFLPPTSSHKNSALIAQNIDIYMVHFPLQASSFFKGQEDNTLQITDSYRIIENRVQELRKLYPNAKYTNNHTGSVFTQNEQAMDYLFKALVKYNFIFVDSRTSPNTVGQKYSKKYNMPYLSRNIFLDNNKDYNYIKYQLIKTIELAKKHGHAIAIGHPNDITLQVLKDSKELLNGVEPVFINKI